MSKKPTRPEPITAAYDMDGYEMSAQQYRDAIEEVGLKQVHAARFLGVGDRTSRRWAEAGHEAKAPGSIAMLFALMIKFKITPEAAAKLAWKMFPE